MKSKSGGAEPGIATCEPATPSHGPVAEDRARAAAIVYHYGHSPLDYFKLWADKSYFFSPSGASVIAYRAAMSVAVSLGDPVGPAHELPGLVESFAAFCAGHRWRTAFHQVGAELLYAYQQHGFHVRKMGEEAIVDLQRFAGETSRQRRFSRPRRRLAAAGYRVSRQHPPHEAGLLDEAEDVSREWLTLPGRRERSFALGRFDRNYLAGRPLVLMRESSGRLVAFLDEVPGVRSSSATVDLMRHRRGAPNGLMDYLFSELMLSLHDEGYRWFSLGLAPFAGVGDGAQAPLPERIAHEVYLHASALFSFKGLRAYKAKFEPVWEDRFLVYQGGPLGLLRTALAVGRLTQG